MSLSKISHSHEKEELAIQALINSFIDNNESLVFSAGAGAGKTYALTESLKHIIKTHGNRLARHNQKIICITYTNVATNKIKERLGNSDIVKVSTIHERMWDLINNYQKELIVVHVEKLQAELARIQSDLCYNIEEKETKQFKAYRELSADKKIDFKNIIIDKKKEFFRFYDKPAKEFKLGIELFIDNYIGLLNNVANFKKTVTTIYKIENYKDCLQKISENHEKYREVKYDDEYNYDVLHRMIISHDTLLEYALNMVKNHKLLKRVILDSYPYILIDEYQDTNKNVVEIMKFLEDYSVCIKRKLFVGYFGDSAQNIYEDGIGSDLSVIHPGLKVVNKQFNRRSHSEIIDVINEIRNDEIKQKSIFEDSVGGTVMFYTGKEEDKYKFIKEYIGKWNITHKNKLHCLVLLNKLVAEFNGFPDIYRYFEDTSYYKINYDSLNNELLNNNLEKLGEVPNLFYRILQFINDLNDSSTTIANLVDKKIYSKMNFLKMKELVSVLKSLKGDSLGEYVKDVFEKYVSSGNKEYRKVIKELINLGRYSYHEFTNHLLDKLFFNIENGRWEWFKLIVAELLENDLFAKADKKEFELFKLRLDNFLADEFFSFVDIKEANAFKQRLYEFIKEQKISTKSSKEMDLFTKKFDQLFQDEIISLIDKDEFETAKTKLDGLLNVKLDQWKIWYGFINSEQKSDVEYHTYHGTKGSEFDNVIIIMENDFGRMNKNKFSSFFRNRKKPSDLDEKELFKFNNTKNLLYVSCSRAIKNLRILYLDDISEFKESIENIFGKTYPYEPSVNSE